MLRFRNSIEDITVKLYSVFVRRAYKNWGKVVIMPSVRIDNPQYIYLGQVKLFRHGWLYAIPPQNAEDPIPTITIKNGTLIHDNFHITCANKVTIGENCDILRNVFISDSLHVYNDTSRLIRDQGLAKGETSIGDGCWIGNNAIIVNSTIGKHCVIAASTVIANQFIPDFSIVAGNPGKVIRTIKEKKPKQFIE